MKIARKTISLVMALITALSTFAICASAADAYSHPKDVFLLQAGTSHLTSAKVAPGETVYASAEAAGEVAYFAVNTGTAAKLKFEFESSANANVTIIPAGGSELLQKDYKDATSYTDTFDVASGKYYYIIVTASEKCDYTFTTTTDAIIDASTNKIIEPTVDISKKTATLYATESLDLDLINAKPTLINFYWAVDDDPSTPMIDEREIVKVDQNGIVTVERNTKDFNSGSITATVYAYVYYNHEVYWKTCTITALPANLDIDPYFDSSAENCLLLGVTGKQSIKYSTNVKNAKVIWSSKDEKIATVSVFGTSATVVGVADGSTEIYADVCVKDAEGNYTDKIARRTIRVDVSSLYSVVTGVEFSESAVSMRVGNSKTLEYKVLHTPDNVKPDNMNVKIESSNPAVATVNAAGVVEAVSAGTATITVTTEDGGYTAKCEVTVKEALPNWLTILVAPFEIIYNLIMMLIGK